MRTIIMTANEVECGVLRKVYVKRRVSDIAR